MQKFFTVVLAFLLLSNSAFAQKFDFDAEDLTEKDGVILMKNGQPVTGTIRVDFFAYHAFVDYVNGQPSEQDAKVYGVNGNFLGKVSVTDPDMEDPLVKKLQASFKESNVLSYYTKKYIYDCASAYSARGASGTVSCTKLIDTPEKPVIGDSSKFRVSEDMQNGKKVIKVEGPFIPVNFRLSLGRADDELGMSSQIQRSGSAVFFFNPYKLYN